MIDSRGRLIGDAAIDAVWAPIEAQVFITREAFVRGLADWEIEEIHIDGRLAFVTLTQGPEFHFVSLGTGKPASLRLIRSLFAPVLARYGCVTTRTPKLGADRQHRFNRLLGFVATGSDEHFISYRLDQTCLS